MFDALHEEGGEVDGPHAQHRQLEERKRTGEQVDGQVDGQVDEQADRQVDGPHAQHQQLEENRWTGGWPGGQADGQVDRWTERGTDRWPARQTARTLSIDSWKRQGQADEQVDSP